MPNVPYNLGIPDTPNDPSDDQPNMKINNDSNDNLWKNGDHFGFNDNKGGRHKQVTFTNEASPALVEGDSIQYTAVYNGQSWPIWKNAGGDTFIMTSNTTDLAIGTASLPGAMCIKWGRIQTTGTLTAVTFAGAFRAASLPFSIVLTIERSSSNSDSAYIEPGSPSTTGFQIHRTFSSNLVVNWIAIGLQ